MAAESSFLAANDLALALDESLCWERSSAVASRTGIRWSSASATDQRGRGDSREQASGPQGTVHLVDRAVVIYNGARKQWLSRASENRMPARGEKSTRKPVSPSCEERVGVSLQTTDGPALLGRPSCNRDASDSTKERIDV